MMNYHVNCDPLKIHIDEHSLVPYLKNFKLENKSSTIFYSANSKFPSFSVHSLFLQIHLMLIELVKNNLKK